jgi:hypothetical protein
MLLITPILILGENRNMTQKMLPEPPPEEVRGK